MIRLFTLISSAPNGIPKKSIRRDKNHKCELCPKAFTEAFNLKRHLKNVHEIIQNVKNIINSPRSIKIKEENIDIKTENVKNCFVPMEVIDIKKENPENEESGSKFRNKFHDSVLADICNQGFSGAGLKSVYIPGPENSGPQNFENGNFGISSGRKEWISGKEFGINCDCMFRHSENGIYTVGIICQPCLKIQGKSA